MVDVRNNYKNKYKNDLTCPICGATTGEIDSQQHLLSCLQLQDAKTTRQVSSYEFIFSFNLEKMKEVVTNIEAALLKRASLIEIS